LKVFDVFASVLLIVFFAGYVDIHSELVGLHEQPVSVGKEVEKFWEALAWGVFAVLAFDAYLKYRRAGDFAKFAKKHWLDLLMLSLIPLFAGLKVASMSAKMIKGAKMAKSGFKAFQGARKIKKVGWNKD
jgi:hypothetical protein